VKKVAIDRSAVGLRTSQRLRRGRDEEVTTAFAAIRLVDLDGEEELTGVGFAEVVAAARGGDKGTCSFGVGRAVDRGGEARDSSEDGVRVNAQVGCCVFEWVISLEGKEKEARRAEGKASRRSREGAEESDEGKEPYYQD
jgi:hypothetical protein